MQKNKHSAKNERKENLSQQMVSKFLPYWPLFLVFAVIAAAAAFGYLRYYTTPIYEASAVLIIKDEKKGNEDSKLTESLDLISSKKIVENEIEVIQSRTLMENVVKKLLLYAPVYEKGKVKAISAYIASPVLVEIKNPDSLHEVGRVNFSYDKKNNTVILNNKFSCPVNQFLQTSYGILRFIPNKNYNGNNSSPNKQLYFSIADPRNVAMGLLSGLNVAASSKLSTVVNLKYRDEVPKRAEDILNGLIQAYEESAILDKNALARNTLSFVEDRLNIVASDLAAIEQKVQQYKSGKSAVDISTQGQLYLQNVSANDQKLSEVNMQLSVLDQVEKFVSSKEGAGGIVPSSFGVSDPMLSDLVNKLYGTELEYEKLKTTVGENNPKLVSLSDQISRMRPSIMSNIQSQRSGLMAAKQNLNVTNSNYNSILNSVPQKERQLLDISREQNIKSNIYSFLLQKKEESALSYASAVSNSRVVDNAQAGSSPVSPNKKLIYAIAILAAMGVCFVFITIKESFTGKVLYRHEIEALTAIPVIGEVSFEKSKKPIVVESGKRSFIVEEFRKLRTSLSFLGINNAQKKILVTSSISGEGKSFIASNLAVSIAATGKKVVLVDMDLNMPTLSKILNVDHEFGITDFLKGKKYPEEIIKPVQGHENLFFISAGELSENPSELLLNGKVNEIIDYLDNSFDLVIIDTSPIVLITDAYILSELCDATLYVMRHGYTPKMLVKRIDENCEINPIHNPAIVFNGVKTRGLFKTNYGYGYNYVYGEKKGKVGNKKTVKS